MVSSRNPPSCPPNAVYENAFNHSAAAQRLCRCANRAAAGPARIPEVRLASGVETGETGDTDMKSETFEPMSNLRFRSLVSQGSSGIWSQAVSQIAVNPSLEASGKTSLFCTLCDSGSGQVQARIECTNGHARPPAHPPYSPGHGSRSPLIIRTPNSLGGTAAERLTPRPRSPCITSLSPAATRPASRKGGLL